MNHLKSAIASLVNERQLAENHLSGIKSAIAALEGLSSVTEPAQKSAPKPPAVKAHKNRRGSSTGMAKAIRGYIDGLEPNESFTSRQIAEALPAKFKPFRNLITGGIRLHPDAVFVSSTHGAGSWATFRKVVVVPSSELELAPV